MSRKLAVFKLDFTVIDSPLFLNISKSSFIFLSTPDMFLNMPRPLSTPLDSVVFFDYMMIEVSSFDRSYISFPDSVALLNYDNEIDD